jgi:hypothetical protein
LVDGHPDAQQLGLQIGESFVLHPLAGVGAASSGESRMGAESRWCQPEPVGGGDKFGVLVVGEPGIDRPRAPREQVRAVPGGAWARDSVVPVGAHNVSQRWRSLGRVKSVARLAPPYQMVSPAALWSSGSATAYPLSWPGLVVPARLPAAM